MIARWSIRGWLLAVWPLVAFAAALPAVAADNPSPAALEQFTTAVAPVLAAKCVTCHRPDNLKGGLDLSTREGMLRGGDGGPALVVTKPADSPLYVRAIPHDGQPPEMPAKGDPLTRAEADALREWIANGAPWPEEFVLRERAKADGTFWSFQPLKRRPPPACESAPDVWRQHPIDRFIAAELAANGLTPNPPATPQAFIRRATYDLTGLPPTPEEVAEFAAAWQSDADRACIELIDRLLASPHYGERWGRHWLDVIRFGESRGYERNEIITNLWPFRDYIIRSFNEDKPFDRLVLEHLAGDVIGRDDPEVEIGSAFLVAGPYDDVGNQDAMAAAQIRADQMDEMIRATGEAFLGLTIGCARCHDHKFDPITARDYYALYATFAGTVHGSREVATEAARQERAARLQPLQEQRQRWVQEKDALEKELLERARQREPLAAREWTRPRISRYGVEETFEPVLAQQVRLIVDGTDAADPNQRQFMIDEFEVWTDEAAPRNVALAAQGATALGESRDARDFSGAYSAALAIDGKFGERWHASGRELQIVLARPERIRRVVFSSDRTRALPEDSSLTVFVGDYVIEVSNDGRQWQRVASSADRAPVNDVRKHARLRQLVTSDDDAARLQRLTAELGRLDAEIARIPPLPVWWVGTHRPAPGPFHLFVGGSPQKRGDEVVPASLEVLRGKAFSYRLPAESDESARRVALAEWIAAPDNPLTPRVLANRVWHYHFGTGLVSTPSDFGYMGGRPSHPELLDWLAAQLVEGRELRVERQGDAARGQSSDSQLSTFNSQPWTLKRLHRLIMTSQTYRQSSAWREDAARVDADSRLLWRFPPRRLTAEELRDTMLALAGKLNTSMGGPGFRLYEYQKDNVATYAPLDAPGPETYRRAVYHHHARAARVDVLSDFDCPDPAFAEPRRAATTTPLQALTLLNHRFSVDMAEFFAERLRREADGAADQVRRAFQLAYARNPQVDEVQAGVDLIAAHGLRAFCRALLNSNELISVN